MPKIKNNVQTRQRPYGQVNRPVNLPQSTRESPASPTVMSAVPQSTRESPASPTVMSAVSIESLSSDSSSDSPHFSRPLPVQVVVGGEYTYNPNDHLGSGGFGSIFKGYRVSDNLPVVLKKISLGDVSYINSIPREVFFHAKAKAVPGVAKLLAYFYSHHHLWLVLYYDPLLLALDDFVLSSGGVSETEALEILHNIGNTLKSLIEEGINHGDLKPENILINPFNLETKLIDFGLAKQFSNMPTNNFGGTALYWPPEVHTSSFYISECVLVWGLGLILYFLLTSRLPFSTRGQIAMSVFPMPNRAKNQWITPFTSYLLNMTLRRYEFGRWGLNDVLHHLRCYST